MLKISLKQELANYGSWVNPVHHLLLYSLWAKMVFTYLNGEKKIKRRKYFAIHEKYMKFKCQCPKIFHQSGVMLICLHIVYGSFTLQWHNWGVMTETLQLTNPKIFISSPLPKKLVDLKWPLVCGSKHECSLVRKLKHKPQIKF